MSKAGMVVWGKSGELLSSSTEKDTTVEHIKFSALDELRDKMLEQGCDGIELDRRKLVLLDHLGNQPKPAEYVRGFKYLFVFVRPSRDMPTEHPDGLPKDFFDEDLFMELTHLDIPKSVLGQCTSLTTSQRLSRYKDHIQSRTDRCKMYAQVASRRADFCNRSSSALQLQNKARDAVCAHIGQLSHKVAESYSDLQERVAKEGTQFDDLLQNFEEDIHRLKDTPIHPSLQMEGRTTLYDCVNDIVPWKERCHEKWQGLTAKLSDFEEDLDKVKREVESINNSLPIGVVDFEGLEQARTESRETALSLRGLQEDAEGCLIGISDRMNMVPHNMVTDPREDVEQDRAWLDIITQQDDKERGMFDKLLKIEKACKLCAQQRQRIQHFMEQHVERAVNLTSEIIKLQRRVTAYSATLEGVREYFHQLQIVRHLPSAYTWGLIELFRRIHYHRKVACVVSTAQQTLNKLKEEEERHRRAWQHTYAPFMPEGILDNLSQPVLTVRIDTEPPVFELSYPGFAKPYDTPEETRAFYSSRGVEAPLDSPAPPEVLKNLCSADLEEELDSLVDGKVLAVEKPQRKPTQTTHIDPKEAEIRELKKRIEELEAAMKHHQEGSSDIIAKCCTVEEALREVPQLRTFTMDDPEEMKKLQTLPDACQGLGVLDPPGPDPTSWPGVSMLFKKEADENGDASYPMPLLPHPATAGYTLEPTAWQHISAPHPEWICIRVVMVTPETRSITGEIVYPRRQQ